MVSSETTKLAIIRRNRYPTKPPIIPYQDAKKWLVKFLSDPARKQHILEDAIDYFNQTADDSSLKPLKRNDAKLSLEAIKSFRDTMANFEANRLTFIAPTKKLAPLSIESVQVKITLDLISNATIKSKNYEGGVILRLTKSEEDTAIAKHKREQMGYYAATLAYMQVADKNPTGREARQDISYAIDVQCGRAFDAKGGARRAADLKSACKMIASIWASI
jgi:hypothetical protein